jgi:hypothetical protein
MNTMNRCINAHKGFSFLAGGPDHQSPGFAQYYPEASLAQARRAGVVPFNR